MRLLRRLHREERGQVLYLTLALLFFLVIFSLVLVNVIYLACLKVKTQNLADSMAISAGTAKARVLNTITDMNALLWVGAWQGGTISPRPYICMLDMMAGQLCMVYAYYTVGREIYQYDSDLKSVLNNLAKANGMREETCQVKWCPLEPILLEDMYGLVPLRASTPEYSCVELTTKPLQYLTYPPLKSNSVDKPLLNFVEMIPHFNTYVQTRVEWKTKDEIIGGERLGVLLPDIVTRARAEIYDANGSPFSFGHNYQVRLTQPDDQMDAWLKNH
jgi:hypothetical protein